ncbi:MAG TPA: hypothetical protein PLD35_04835, partial [Caldisericia bacterium]|nr:hypothetical protein [Caldisericia bacterium]
MKFLRFQNISGSSIKDFEDDSGCVFEDDISVVIPAKAGIQEVFLSSNIREKNNIDSPLLISGIT